MKIIVSMAKTKRRAEDNEKIFVRFFLEYPFPAYCPCVNFFLVCGLVQEFLSYPYALAGCLFSFQNHPAPPPPPLPSPQK